MIDTAQLSPWVLVLVPAVMFVAYTIFGISGFGSTVIAVPILAHFVPVSYIVPLMAILDCGSASFVGSTAREHTSKPELKRLVPFMFGGFVIGLTVLVGVPDQYLRGALGVFAVAIGLHGIVNPSVQWRIGPGWALPTGLVGGAIAAIFGAGGPLYATYLAGRLPDMRSVRSTLSTLIAISAFSRTILYAVAGLVLHASMLAGLALSAPFAWAGVRLGSRIHVGLSPAQMRRIVGGVILATGVSLLVRIFL